MITKNYRYEVIGISPNGNEITKTYELPSGPKNDGGFRAIQLARQSEILSPTRCIFLGPVENTQPQN